MITYSNYEEEVKKVYRAKFNLIKNQRQNLLSQKYKKHLKNLKYQKIIGLLIKGIINNY
jgi:hypothetical protein